MRLSASWSAGISAASTACGRAATSNRSCCPSAALPTTRSIGTSRLICAGERSSVSPGSWAGRSEVALGIFGAPPPEKGEIWLNDKQITIDRPRTAMQQGFGLVPEDRKVQGLVLMHSVATNLSLAAIPRMSSVGMIIFASERKLVDKYVQRLRVKTPSTEQVIGLLSGGNQQKVVLAKWLATDPSVLIIDEPTRGVDIGAKAEIYALMRELAADGLAILVISSDLPDILNYLGPHPGHAGRTHGW